jgi:hypothetical protein
VFGCDFGNVLDHLQMLLHLWMLLQLQMLSMMHVLPLTTLSVCGHPGGGGSQVDGRCAYFCERGG